jgi:ligand-binding sensor protein
MELVDVLPAKAWKELAEDIHRRFGINGGVNDKKSFLVAASSHYGNKICAKVREGEESRAICVSVQHYLAKLSQESKEPAVAECDVGLTKFVVPIFWKDEFLGTAGGCGVLAEEDEIDAFYVARVLHLSEEEVEKWIRGVKKVSHTELETAIAYLKECLKEILPK